MRVLRGTVLLQGFTIQALGKDKRVVEQHTRLASPCYQESNIYVGDCWP